MGRTTNQFIAVVGLVLLWLLQACSTTTPLFDTPTKIQSLKNPSVSLKKQWSQFINTPDNWNHSFTQLKTFTPAFNDQIMITLNQHNQLVMIDLTSGDVTRKIEFNEAINAGLTLVHPWIFLAVTDGTLFAINNRLDVMFDLKTKLSFTQSPFYDDDFLYIRSTDNRITAISIPEKKQLWTFGFDQVPLSFEGQSGIVFTEDELIFSIDNGTIVGLNKKTGAQNWLKRLYFPTGDNPIEKIANTSIVKKDGVLFATTVGGVVSAFHIENRAILWQNNISSAHEPVVVDERVFVLDEQGSLYALEKQTGVIIWQKQDLAHHALKQIILWNNHLIIPAYQDWIHIFDLDGNLVGREKTSSITRVYSYDNWLFVEDEIGNISAYTLES